MSKIALLNSGGMDSALVLHHLAFVYKIPAHEIVSVFVNIGQKYAHKENNSAVRLASYFGVNHVNMYGAKIAGFEHISGIIPFRNAELILCAAQCADNIALGVLKDEVNSDKSSEFFYAMEKVLNISHRPQYWTEGREFQIELPLADGTKAEHLTAAIKDVPLRTFLNTVSCYADTKFHCGNCPSCFKRWVALTLATGKKQNEEYLTPPWHYMDKEGVIARNDWSQQRKYEILRALEIASQ